MKYGIYIQRGYLEKDTPKALRKCQYEKPGEGKIGEP